MQLFTNFIDAFIDLLGITVTWDTFFYMVLGLCITVTVICIFSFLFWGKY